MWILISIFILIVLIAVIFLVMYKHKKSGKKQEPDYYMFFILGIVWTGAGVALATTTDNFGFIIMGLVFMVLGLVNKDKWKTNHKTYKDLSKKEQKIKLWTMILLGILVLGLVAYFILRI